MRKALRLLFEIVVLSLSMALLAGCFGNKKPAATEVPDLAYTQAAQTIVAQLTEGAPKEIVTETVAPVYPAPTEASAPPPAPPTPTSPPPPPPTTSEVPAQATQPPEQPTQAPAQPPAQPVVPTQNWIPTAIPLPTGLPPAIIPGLPPQPPAMTFPTAIPLPGIPPASNPPPLLPTAPSAYPTAEAPATVMTSTEVTSSTVPSSVNFQTVYADDFSTTYSGWESASSVNWVMGYYGGGYRMWNDFTQDALWSVRNRDSFSDVSVQVEATRLVGANAENGSDGYYGVICRAQGPNIYYGLVVKADGNYGIFKKKVGGVQFIQESTQPSNLIAFANTPNKIRGDCIGNYLTLYVNDQPLLTVQDSDLASGFYGMVVGTQKVPGMDVVFDNLLIKAP